MRYRVMQRVQSDAVCRAFRRGPVATSSKAVIEEGAEAAAVSGD